MTTATIEFSGCYGSFKVCAASGVVLEHNPDRDAISEESRTGALSFGYLDIIRVDLAERRAWYAARGVTMPDCQPDGDVLDVALWSALTGYDAAASDYREEILIACYPDAAKAAGLDQ